MASIHGEVRGFQGQMRLQAPVGINGPVAPAMRLAAVGDLIQLQVFAPVVPGPDPVSVRMRSESGTVALVSAAKTGGAMYLPGPGETVTGLIGTTNYSIFIKAVFSGQDLVTAEIEMSDGTTRSVPFSFDIS